MQCEILPDIHVTVVVSKNHDVPGLHAPGITLKVDKSQNRIHQPTLTFKDERAIAQLF